MEWSRHLGIQQAARTLEEGGVIAYPTEAVWGLGCSPQDEEAVLRLLATKQRDYDKGLILVAANIEQFSSYLQPLSSAQQLKLTEGWPGPITWLVPDLNNLVPKWIKGRHQSVALRVSAHPVVSGLCHAFGGPIVSTSANPQGKQPALHQWQVHRYFGDSLDMVTPGRIGTQTKPTEIRDLISGEQVRAS